MTDDERNWFDSLQKRRHELRKACSAMTREIELLRGRVWSRQRYQE
jgi:hypothetical protein